MNAEPTPADVLLTAIHEAGAAVSLLTGIRQQFIDQGWSEHHAELATLEMLRKAKNERTQRTPTRVRRMGYLTCTPNPYSNGRCDCVCCRTSRFGNPHRESCPMKIDWPTTVFGIVRTTPEEDAVTAKVAATFFNNGFYVTNKSATRLSHLVLSADFTDGDTEVTLCGIEVEGAGLWPTFEWCADCLKTADPDDEPDIGQIEDEWNHPTPCDDMNCKEHGVAASLDRQSEFFARGRTLGDEGP